MTSSSSCVGAPLQNILSDLGQAGRVSLRVGTFLSTSRLILTLDGFMASDIAALGDALGAIFSERQSDYWGGRYYKAGQPPEEEIYVFQNNADPSDGSVVYTKAQPGAWVIRFDRTTRKRDDVIEAIERSGRIKAAL